MNGQADDGEPVREHAERGNGGGLSDEIVSSDEDLLILVDAEDNERGTLSKARCHDGHGVLHRAFSLFVFNGDGELLLQQRSRDKRLWPGYWSNSCCSHPRAGERMEEAVHRRLAEELGIGADLSYLYKFVYQADFGEAGAEHELCWVYAGVTGDPVRANRHEIADWRYVTPAALERELAERPERFTPWFKLEWEQLSGPRADELDEALGAQLT